MITLSTKAIKHEQTANNTITRKSSRKLGLITKSLTAIHRKTQLGKIFYTAT